MLNYANIVPSIPTNNVTKLYNVGFISIPNILVIDTKFLIIDTNVANSVTFVTNLWLSRSPVMEAKTRLAPLFCSQQIFCGYVFLEDYLKGFIRTANLTVYERFLRSLAVNR